MPGSPPSASTAVARSRSLRTYLATSTASTARTAMPDRLLLPGRVAVPAHGPEYGDVHGWAVPTQDPRTTAARAKKPLRSWHPTGQERLPTGRERAMG